MGNYLCAKYLNRDFVHFILNSPYDPRISHMYNHKGVSVYQSKMQTLEVLSGLKAPDEITYKVDSIIVKFYYGWANSPDSPSMSE